MAEITWIKLRTNMFDDEKIKLLERLPDGDMILVVWIKLLAQAGKVNCGGYIMIAENIPMTVDEMAIVFNRPIEKVTFAIQALQRYGMIEVDENATIFISNWEKHQNIDGMEKIRLQNAERQKRHRQKKKQIELPEPENSNVTHNVTVTECNALDIDKDKEKEYKDNYVDLVISKLKECQNVPVFRKMSEKRKKAINARLNEYSFDDVIIVLDNIENSEFFKTSKQEKANWYDIEWIFNPNNFLKILEGKYNSNRNNNNTINQSTTTLYKPAKDDLYGDVEI